MSAPAEGRVQRLVEEAAGHLEAGAWEEAAAAARRGARLAREAGEPEAEAELAYVEGAALAQLGEPGAALPRLEAALALRPDDLDAALERGLALFEVCRFEDARRALMAVLRAEPDDPWAIHTLGLIAERRGDAAEAKRRFTRARRLAPDEFPEPVAMTAQDFDAAVEAAMAELPEGVRRWLANVAIAVEDVPADDDLLASDPPHSPSILGIFRGAPLGAKESMDPWSHFPSSIVLYQRNLQRLAGDRDDLVDEIRVTLLHEVGHFLGLDEEDLARLGLD
ncbi:MAG TPA: metallopeptidase family protein [Anaeromyxobacteraceae bacterium]|nr:metallopeptidase family protein [Anaeromyxobacteraceae bacterium]